ncbi:MAG: hypothetical protein II007_15040 [Gammaproteobacteria bacterium]|nr:hypothetical protein [Gammaproteobacteria bacterium]
MKFSTHVLFFLICVFSVSAYAGGGKAIVPHWSVNDGENIRTYIYITNISDSDVNVEIDLLDKSGNQVAPFSYTNFINSNSGLAAKSSGLILLKGAPNFGHAIIKWTNTAQGDDVVALVAHGSSITSNGSSWRSEIAVPINNGQPF